MGIGLCRNKDCTFASKCLRFLDTDGEEFNFANICGEFNEYKWFWKADQDLVVKEDKKDTNNT